MKQAILCAIIISMLVGVSLIPSTITYAADSQSTTTPASKNSGTTERTVSSSSTITGDDLKWRLDTLAGIWIEAQNIKRNLDSLTLLENRSNEEKAIEKIVYYSMKYSVVPKELYAIVKCESRFDPDAHQKNSKEDSWSWVQINTKVHKVSVEQAKNIDFAIDFLAKNWSEGKREMWYECSKKNGLL